MHYNIRADALFAEGVALCKQGPHCFPEHQDVPHVPAAKTLSPAQAPAILCLRIRTLRIVIDRRLKRRAGDGDASQEPRA